MDQPKKTYSAAEMAALEQTAQFQEVRAAYDARHGQHDELGTQRAIRLPAPGASLFALNPRPTIVGPFTLPPITGAHYVLLQESGLKFAAKMFEDAALKLSTRDVGEAIYFFTLTADAIESILAEGGWALFRRRAMDVVMKQVRPSALPLLSDAVQAHLEAGSAPRLDLEPLTDGGGDDDANPTSAAANPSSMVLAGSSNSSPG